MTYKYLAPKETQYGEYLARTWARKHHGELVEMIVMLTICLSLAVVWFFM